MPAQVLSYKCPACTGPLHFAGGSGMLECDYCGGKYTVEEIEKLYNNAEEKAADAFNEAEKSGGHSSQEEYFGEDMRAYNCPSCGAQLICDSTAAAISCPYCGNPAVVPGQLNGALKPDFIIPFKLSKEDAVNALREHYKNKFMLPRAFSSENHIREIQGVYVPFWLYSGRAEANASFKATTSLVYDTGDYTVTETRHFDVSRSGSLRFERVPVDGSKKMPDDHMDSIEPFDYTELRPFSTAYMPGFVANKYDESFSDCAPRAETRVENTVLDRLEDTVSGYQTVIRTDSAADFAKDKPQYALLPVWMLSTSWNGKNYLFAMNGQTGKLVGDLPLDKGRFWGLFAAITAGGTAVLSLLSLLI